MRKMSLVANAISASFESPLFLEEVRAVYFQGVYTRVYKFNFFVI
jgi:hypothetical protein